MPVLLLLDDVVVVLLLLDDVVVVFRHREWEGGGPREKGRGHHDDSYGPSRPPGERHSPR